MIFITGDTHGDFSRFSESGFEWQKDLTRNDCVIIAGDFGGVWFADDEKQERMLDALEALPFTTLFIAGNHDNYDLLEKYPVGLFCGGRAQCIRPHVIHLMRGEIYTIESHTFFVMGGAQSHDIHCGVLDPDDPDYEAKYKMLKFKRQPFRIKHLSWWPQELPDDAELDAAWANLKSHRRKVDCIITHCAPGSVQTLMEMILDRDEYPENRLTAFLDKVRSRCRFKVWYFGHYHTDAELGKFRAVSEDIVQLPFAPRRK